MSWSLSLTALLPTQTGHSGELLSTDGAGTLSWASASGLTLAAVGSTPNTNGLTLTGSALNVQPADGTYGGVVSTTTQTFAGVKTFSSVPVAAGISAPTTSTLTLSGNRTDGGTNIGVVIDNLVALTTAGAKIVSFQNHEAEKASIDLDGNAIGTSFSATGAMPSINSGASIGSIFGTYYGLAAVNAAVGNYLLISDGTSTLLNANTTSIIFKIGNAECFHAEAATIDCTALGNGGSIKLKSPDGTTYTA